MFYFGFCLGCLFVDFRLFVCCVFVVNYELCVYVGLCFGLTCAFVVCYLIIVFFVVCLVVWVGLYDGFLSLCVYPFLNFVC